MAAATQFPTTDDQLLPSGNVLRRYVDSNINQTVNDALGQLTPGKHGAMIGFVDREVGRFAIIARFGDHWSAVGVAEHTWDIGKNDYAGAVRFEF